MWPLVSKICLPDVTTGTSQEIVETLLSLTVTQPLIGGGGGGSTVVE